MRWNKYTINTLASATDIISCELAELGIEGIEIEDNIQLSEEDKQSMFIDFLPEVDESDKTAKISFYLEDGKFDDVKILTDVRAMLKEISEYCEIGDGTIQSSQTEDKDWANNWKKYFKSFCINDIYIKPTWEEEEDEYKDKTKILIDPGAAFGTGAHETTKLVILQLQKYLKKDDMVLDVGCGSGILSIVALKLGAKHALGTDLDPVAIVSSRENAEVNGIAEEDFELIKGNIIDEEPVIEAVGFERYDVVCANILAEVLVPLSKVIYKHMKMGAYLIMSGIIDSKEELIKKTFDADEHYEVVEVNRLGEWSNVTVKRVK